MLPILAAAALLLLLAAPGLYARAVLARHAGDRPDLPGTGGEFARHVLDEAGLHGVRVEPTDGGDHYDARARAVRLRPENLGGRSLTAVAVAAHEAAHALQHAQAWPPFQARLRIVPVASALQTGALALLAAAPLAAVVAPGAAAVAGLCSLALVLARIAADLSSLPVEHDASFGRALPLLARHLDRRDMAAARSVLRACELTYVAAVLTSMLHAARHARFR